MNKTLPRRLNWEQIEREAPREKQNVIKGTSKRVVVVRSPDPKVFEEAIFIVKEDYLGRGARPDALKEAQRVANAYIRSAVSPKRRKLRFPPMIWALIGVILSCAAFALINYL